MRSLIKLFEENFKPYDVILILGLSKSFIISNGYTENDIENLINNGKIEHSGNGYRMSKNYLKMYCGSSYKYVPEYAK